ncbi:hypothetical protein GCM10027610_072940 [Dactylosporangium cerinum]
MSGAPPFARLRGRRAATLIVRVLHRWRRRGIGAEPYARAMGPPSPRSPSSRPPPYCGDRYRVVSKLTLTDEPNAANPAITPIMATG